MTISDYSPYLAGTLGRYFNKQEFGYIESSFICAINNGGLDELDFSRKPGVSFNPRPARVALILINNAKLLNLNAVSAAIILSANHQKILYEPYLLSQLLLTGETMEIIKIALNAPIIDPLHPAAIVAISLWLDRARHLHQTQNPNKKKLWTDFLLETEKYLCLAQTASEPLHILLHSWKERFINRLSTP